MPELSVHQAARDCRHSLAVVEDRHVDTAKRKQRSRDLRYYLGGGSAMAGAVFVLLQISRVFVG